MEPISMIDRLKMLLQIITDSPFFVMIFLASIFTLIILIINVKTKKRIIKSISAVIYILIISFVFYKYGKPILLLGDTVIDKIFTVMYFPSAISYTCMIVLSILFLIYVFVDKKISKASKYISTTCFVFILFLFILTLDTIISEQIDITSKVSIYESSALVILIQSSTICFFVWLISLFIIMVVNLLDKRYIDQLDPKKYNKDAFNKLRVEKNFDNKDLKKSKVEDIKLLSESEFKTSFNKYKKTKEDEIVKYVDE